MPNVKTLLFGETDGSCAYCGIKDYRILSVHHIHQGEPKDESYDNKILLCHNCHHLFHENKGPTLNNILDIKKRLILKTLTQAGANALKECYRNGYVVAAPYLVNHLVELGILKNAKLTNLQKIIVSSRNQTIIKHDIYELTTDGYGFVEKWKIK